MELRILRYFLAVASEENISKAARSLHITQPTLSRQLHDLEEELGVTLFERGSRHITLTPQGLLFRRRAREIIELADKAEEELTCCSDQVKGTVSIGAGELQSVGRLSEYILDFSRQHPHVSFNLFTATADQIQSNLDQGLLDLAVMLEPLPSQQYEMIRFLEEEHFVAVMAPDHPLASSICVKPEDLKDIPLILPSRPEIRKALVSWMQGNYDETKVVMTTNLSYNGILMAQAGIGVFLCVEGPGLRIAGSEAEVRSLQPALSAFSDVVWKPDVPLNPAATLFLRFLKEKGDL